MPKNEITSIKKEQLTLEKEEKMGKEQHSFEQSIQVLNEPFEKLTRSDRMEKFRRELRDVYTMK